MVNNHYNVIHQKVPLSLPANGRYMKIASFGYRVSAINMTKIRALVFKIV